jgi:hypothetical protein
MNTRVDKAAENRNPATGHRQSNSNPVFQLMDNRPEAVAQRNMQKAISSSSHVQQLNARQEMINNSPQVLQQKAPIQMVKLNPAAAVAQADAKRTANPHNRAAMTNDWIANSDEGATTAAWALAAPRGYIYNSSASITNGGADRPTSIDLKAKPQGGIEAEFIFHLPRFTGIPAMIDYLIRTSGIRRKTEAINDLSRINLAASNDFELRKIEDAESVDIAPLKNNPVYLANKAEILAHDPDFLTNLTNQIGVKNAELDNIRDNPDYISRLANKKAREAKQTYVRVYRIVPAELPAERGTTDYGRFAGVENNMLTLNRAYATASALFSEEETQHHLALNAIFNRYKQIRTEFENFRRDLTAAYNAAQHATYPTQGSWQLAVQQRAGFGELFRVKRLNWTGTEKHEVAQLLKDFGAVLSRKKPVSGEPEKETELDKRKRGDKDDPDPKKKFKPEVTPPPPVTTVNT